MTNKKVLSESDICDRYITPAVTKAGRAANRWRREFGFEWRREQSEQLAVAGRDPRPEDPVFAKGDGEPIHPDYVSQVFERHLATSELLRIRLHDLRHTHATILLKAGIPVKVVSERLGHSSPAFTMNVYQHVLPGMQADAARAFGRAVFASDALEEPPPLN